MISLSASQLITILAIPSPRAVIWQPHLEATMARFAIDTPLRAAHWLAQVGHESGGFRYMHEIWTNSQAQQSYEGAARLGNTVPGDGERFMGRGPMEITGRKNYRALSYATGIDFIAQPQLLERLDYGALSAGWFWQQGAGLNLGAHAREALGKYGLGVYGVEGCVDMNEIADRDDIETITLCINGGLNGYADRCEILRRARVILLED